MGTTTGTAGGNLATGDQRIVSVARKGFITLQVEIGACPYDDGSGFAMTVEAKAGSLEHDNDEARVMIKQGSDMLVFAPELWADLRSAVDQAIVTVFGPTLPANTSGGITSGDAAEQKEAVVPK
jgi:hypothetical protein